MLGAGTLQTAPTSYASALLDKVEFATAGVTSVTSLRPDGTLEVFIDRKIDVMTTGPPRKLNPHPEAGSAWLRATEAA
jgi:hypothetical protein